MKVVLKEDGKGYRTKNGDRLRVNYTGKLLDGTVFDSSLDKGRKPIEFNLGHGQVIKCWDMSFNGLMIGAKGTVTCPAEFAYGNRAMGDKIPPNSALIFDFELLEVVRKTKKE